MPLAMAASPIPPGLSTGFEPAGSPTEATNPFGYVTGSVLFQGDWVGAGQMPRVQTAAEISAELAAAGLNPAGPVRSGNQALLVAKPDTSTDVTGYFAENVFASLIANSKVTIDYWARPLTSGAGADPSGAPMGNGKTIGERQGNVFIGISDENRVRAAAIRFGVTTAPGSPPFYGGIVARHIDFGSASAGSAVWVDSGFTWQADQWIHIRLDLDYSTKTYDAYFDGLKANVDPIRFYSEASLSPNRLFVSRGTNQAGMILDDIRVVPEPASFGIALVAALFAIFAGWRRWRSPSIA
ncbi:hypothetical protein [Lacipirellula sp.]|uniref:hypothetical protein n=1 Tax=Lacipirellula sp. TaxID=2691419 RepID=UPI003D0EAAAE